METYNYITATINFVEQFYHRTEFCWSKGLHKTLIIKSASNCFMMCRIRIQSLSLLEIGSGLLTFLTLIMRNENVWGQKEAEKEKKVRVWQRKRIQMRQEEKEWKKGQCERERHTAMQGHEGFIPSYRTNETVIFLRGFFLLQICHRLDDDCWPANAVWGDLHMRTLKQTVRQTLIKDNG